MAYQGRGGGRGNFGRGGGRGGSRGGFGGPGGFRVRPLHLFCCWSSDTHQHAACFGGELKLPPGWEECPPYGNPIEINKEKGEYFKVIPSKVMLQTRCGHMAYKTPELKLLLHLHAFFDPFSMQTLK
eukprot:1160087-Pelagomonas_calceolata.AAC.5